MKLRSSLVRPLYPLGDLTTPQIVSIATPQNPTISETTRRTDGSSKVVYKWRAAISKMLICLLQTPTQMSRSTSSHRFNSTNAAAVDVVNSSAFRVVEHYRKCGAFSR